MSWGLTTLWPTGGTEKWSGTEMVLMFADGSLGGGAILRLVAYDGSGVPSQQPPGLAGGVETGKHRCRRGCCSSSCSSRRRRCQQVARSRTYAPDSKTIRGPGLLRRRPATRARWTNDAASVRTVTPSAVVRVPTAMPGRRRSTAGRSGRVMRADASTRGGARSGHVSMSKRESSACTRIAGGRTCTSSSHRMLASGRGRGAT